MHIKPPLVIMLLGAGVLCAGWWLRPAPSAVAVPQSPAAALPAPASVSHTIPVAIDVAERGGSAVAEDGSIWIWGSSFFESNNTPLAGRHMARRLPGITGVASVSLSDGHMLALRKDGTVWATGNNAGGQLGVHIPDGRLLTHDWFQVPGLNDIRQVLATTYISLAVRGDGTVWAWGINGWGRLGKDFPGKMSAAPVQLSGLQGIRSVTASDDLDSYYALRDDGRVLAWGHTYRLGFPYEKDAPEYTLEPRLLDGLEHVSVIAGGRSSQRDLLALREDGSVVLWGGDGGVSNCNLAPTPLELPDLQGSVSIARGTIDIFAVKADGSFWVWGLVDVDGRGVCMEAPRQYLPPGSAAAVTASGLSNLLLLRKGQVLSWGNSSGIMDTAVRDDITLDWERRVGISGLMQEQ